MKTRRIVLFVFGMIMTSAFATADVKVVKITYENQILMMTHGGPGTQHKTVIYIGEDRLKIDDKVTTMIVRLDEKTMYIINHDAKTTSPITLPIDLASQLPKTMNKDVLETLKFNITVTPTEQKRQVGSWMAQRYDVSMISPMAKLESKVWVTEDLGFDFDMERYLELYDTILSLQPGIVDSLSELHKIKGFEVARESVVMVSVLAGNSVSSTEKVISIAEVEAPEGTYEPPAAYEVVPFDFSSMARGHH